MSLRDVLLVYALVGLGCGIFIVRRADAIHPRVVCEALLTVPLWPLWVPFALSPREETRRTSTAERIVGVLGEAIAAARVTPFGGEVSPRLLAATTRHVTGVANGITAVDALIARGELDMGRAASRLSTLREAGAGASAVAMAGEAREGTARLLARRTTDAAHLEELLDLVIALRSELILARVPERASDTSGDVRARLEALTAALRDTRELTRT